MRTIRECICDSTQKIGDLGLPICLDYLFKNMAIILLYDAEGRLRLDCPDVTMGTEKTSGKAKEKTGLDDYISVLKCDDFVRSINQHMQLHDFLEWFLEQNEPDGENVDSLWYDLEFIGEKWNEYAKEALNDR